MPHHVAAVMVVAHHVPVAVAVAHVVMVAVHSVHPRRDDIGRGACGAREGRGGGSGSSQAERGHDGERQQGLLQGRVPLLSVPPRPCARRAPAAREATRVRRGGSRNGQADRRVPSPARAPLFHLVRARGSSGSGGIRKKSASCRVISTRPNSCAEAQLEGSPRAASG